MVHSILSLFVHATTQGACEYEILFRQWKAHMKSKTLQRASPAIIYYRIFYRSTSASYSHLGIAAESLVRFG
ncbi:hypothetical protein HZ326_31576 [Fusarium oxysporum f. sp. albedinis]|nr:hypothetical protein HZ326_31576 [Fusarium oxysporum f. sp. albedinis]